MTNFSQIAQMAAVTVERSGVAATLTGSGKTESCRALIGPVDQVFADANLVAAGDQCAFMLFDPAPQIIPETGDVLTLGAVNHTIKLARLALGKPLLFTALV